MSVKALLKHVLDEVAIDGEEGTSIQQLFQYVNDFYTKSRQPRHDLHELLAHDETPAGAAPPAPATTVPAAGFAAVNATGNADPPAPLQKPAEDREWGLPNVQEDFQEYVWRLLKKERGFTVGKNNEGAGFTLKEMVARMREAGDAEAPEFRVYADEERRWMALTGHGVNHTLVPKSLYKCLEVIGKHREEGLIQPELTVLTGQDKRSISMRTNALKEHGYIEKIGVLAKNHNTSKLTLTRFAILRDQRKKLENPDYEKNNPIKDAWTGELIQIEQLVKGICTELKAVKSRVLMRSELKVKLGLDQSKFHWRAFSRILARMEGLGLWKRIRVPLRIKSTVIDEHGNTVPATRKDGRDDCTYARCIRWIRDPTPDDWARILSPQRLAVMEDDEGDDGSDAEGGPENAAADAAAAKELSKVDTVQEVGRDVPLWNPLESLPNTVFDLVQDAGQEGLASMDTIGKAVGTFYYRPMDQVLHRLTDFPTRGQPRQYLNYSIIRETSITQRQTHYRYFAYEDHQELVKKGLATQPWEAKQKPKKKGGKITSQVEDGQPPMADVDEFGFPPVDTSRLIKKDASGTLAESQRRGMRGERIKNLCRMFFLKTAEDGEPIVDWGTRMPNGSRPQKPKYDGPPRPQGRPRKDGTVREGWTPKPREPRSAQKRPRGDAMLSDSELPPPKKWGRPKGPGKKTLQKQQKAAAMAAKKAEKAEMAEGEKEGEGPAEEEEKQGEEEVERKEGGDAPAADAGEYGDTIVVATPAVRAAMDRAQKAAKAAKHKDDPVEAQLFREAVEAVSESGTPEVTPAPTTAKGRGKGRASTANQTATAPSTRRTTRSTTKHAAAATPAPSTPVPETPSKRAATGTPGSRVDMSKRRKQGTLDFFLNTPKGSVPPAQSSPERTPSRRAKVSQPTKVADAAADKDAMDVDQSAEEVAATAESGGDEVMEEASAVIAEEQPAEEEEPVVRQPRLAQATVTEVPPVHLDEPAVSRQPTFTPITAVENSAAQQAIDGASTGVQAQPSEPPTGEEPVVTVDGTKVKVDKVDPNVRESYNSIGGMLALGRQQCVMDLLNKHDGVFPAGLELRHAFNKAYMDKHPKAGLADRRLVKGIVESLMMKQKVNQLTFTFMTKRRMPCEKKIVVRADIPFSDPRVTEMTRNIIAADGGLWFPPNTDLPPDVAIKLGQNNMLGPQGGQIVKDVQFDRLYPSAIDLIKQQRAVERAKRAADTNAKKHVAEERRQTREKRKAEKAAAVAARWDGKKFSEEQKAEAKMRKKELKRQEKAQMRAERALLKLNSKYRSSVPDAVNDPLDKAPRTVWWNDYVDRTDTNIIEDINNVEAYELAAHELGRDEAMVQASREKGELPMVNHFAPPQALPKSFPQLPADMDNLNPPQRTFAQHKLTPYAPYVPLEPLPDSEEEEPLPRPERKKRQRRRRLLDPDAPPRESRRQAAMKLMHNNTLETAVERNKDTYVQKTISRRKNFTMPKDDEDTMLIAVIISRSLFADKDRKIEWDIVKRVLPQHDVDTLRGRWPRVRDTHKAHLKRLQAEFEEMYLEAYAKGQLPPVDTTKPEEFDLAYHVEWFKKNLSLPEPDSVSELPASKEQFEKYYTIKPEKVFTWRSDFHNPITASGNRMNNFVCYPYQTPRFPEKHDYKNVTPVEYAKSVIKSNIMTEESKYDAKHAFEILRSLPEDAVDEAFYDLNYTKVIAHKKEHGRAAPGRNYELTDRFHFSLRTAMDEKLFAQAVNFSKTVAEHFAKQEQVVLSPFMEDGVVACTLDLLANNRIRLQKRNYKTNVMGLINGYETRAMPKHLVDFEVRLRPLPSYWQKPSLPGLPQIPPTNKDDPSKPMRLWMDINRDVISGVWLRCCTAVLFTVTSRPGIMVEQIAEVLKPGITMLEAEEVLEWLMLRNAVMAKEVAGVRGYFAKENYYLALEGL